MCVCVCVSVCVCERVGTGQHFCNWIWGEDQSCITGETWTREKEFGGVRGTDRGEVKESRENESVLQQTGCGNDRRVWGVHVEYTMFVPLEAHFELAWVLEWGGDEEREKGSNGGRKRGRSCKEHVNKMAEWKYILERGKDGLMGAPQASYFRFWKNMAKSKDKDRCRSSVFVHHHIFHQIKPSFAVAPSLAPWLLISWSIPEIWMTPSFTDVFAEIQIESDTVNQPGLKWFPTGHL